MRRGRTQDIRHLTIDGLPVEVRRGGVRRCTLRVTEAATVKVSAPARMPLYEIERFVRAQRDWIAPRLAAAQRRVIEQERLAQLSEGDKILVWGEARTIAYEEGARSRKSVARVEGGTVTLALAPGHEGDDPEAVEARQTAVIALWKRELEGQLKDIAEHAEALVGSRASKWSVRLMTTRWGSCTPKTRAIRLSSLLARAPLDCARYVAVHEACHLLEPSHNARFHSLMDEHCPEWRALRARLEAPSPTWRP